MKPGDLIEVCGGSAKVAVMYDENWCVTRPVPQGIIGIVLEVLALRGEVGYVKVLLSGDRVGFIYKDALRITE